MKMNMETTKKMKQRKLLWVLPIMALPFVTLLFWSMGGGSVTGDANSKEKKGFNLKLPQTTLQEENFTKLNYYDKAEQDSSKQAELRKKDPFFASGPSSSDKQDSIMEGTPLTVSSFAMANEQKVLQRLKALQKAVTSSGPESTAKRAEVPNRSDSYQRDEESVKRLEQMMQAMETPAPEDKEMQQINGMLENILDLQYPDRIRERSAKERRLREGEPAVVGKPESTGIVSSLEQRAKDFGQPVTVNGFYSLHDNSIPSMQENAFTATIAESQTCVNGSTVKLRLTEDISVDGKQIPQNTFVYGTASLKGERLSVEINSIRYQNSVYPIELILYDMDGLEGIFIPGAISRDVAKASADRSLQGIGITTLNDSWGAQAAGAGVEAAKSLFSKKVKLVKVAIKSGYQVLLKQKKNTK